MSSVWAIAIRDNVTFLCYVFRGNVVECYVEKF